MSQQEKYYTRIGRATELAGKKYIQYRFFEILPGFITWGTLISMVLFSWLRPVWVAFFILSFDVYWLLKTIYLTFHLRATFNKMRLNLKTDWLKELFLVSLPAEKLSPPIQKWQDVWHMVILPVYKESSEVMRSTLRSIFETSYPKDRMIIVMGIEERAGQEAQQVGWDMEKEFKDKFAYFILVTHPDGVEGELRGKGSNETWAIKKAKELVVDRQKIPYEHIIVSSFDADTQVYNHYFSRLTYVFLTCSEPLRSSFQPIPVFNNNIWEAPFFSRLVACSATFWQMMQQERKDRLVSFSSHSLPFKALVEVGFWQTNIVSEDSRIFWQLFLWFDGKYYVEPLYYPVSMDANVGKRTFETMRNIYKQQRRWAYGVENFSYIFYGFVRNKSVPLKKRLYYVFVLFEGFWSWSTNALMISLLGWLPVMIGGWEFQVTVLGSNLPSLTRRLMMVTMAGLILSAIYSYKLLPPKPAHVKGKYFIKFVTIFQWVLLPLTLIIFGSIPAIDAQTRLMLGRYMGFWVTPKFRKERSEN